MAWLCISEGADDRRIHAMPADDDLVHLEGMHCPCKPELRMIFVYEHVFAARGQVIHNWVGEEPDEA